MRTRPGLGVPLVKAHQVRRGEERGKEEKRREEGGRRREDRMGLIKGRLGRNG